jgi:hypothetical protein
MKLDALTFGMYILTLAVSSWCSVPFINMKWPFFWSLLMNFDMRIAIFNCFQDPFPQKMFFHPFILSQHLFLLVRSISHRQQKVVSCFLIQFTVLCLLFGELRPWTFGVNVEMCVVISSILLLLVLFDSFLLLILLSTDLVRFIYTYLFDFLL